MTKEKPLENQMWRPVITERRWNWIVSGLVNFIIVFIVALVFWYVFMDWRFSLFYWSGWLFLGSAIAGWGILIVVFQIWFDHYLSSKMKSLVTQGIVGTILNIVGIAVVIAVFWFVIGPYMIPMFSPFALMNVASIGGNWWLALFLSSAAIGTILSCGFSFASIWAAGSIYWPFTELEQPKRGFTVMLLGAVITTFTWLILYWPFQIATALPPVTTTVDWTIWTAWPFWAYDPIAGEVNNGGAYLSLAFTQWIIVFGLMTLMTWDYQPWKALKKQPWIGVAALIGCTLLGGLFAFLIMPFLLSGIMLTMGFAAMHGYSAWIAVFIILLIFIWTQYFGNWPNQFTTIVNILIRTIIVVVLGIISLYIYFFISPMLLGDFLLTGVYNPVNWVLWLLWAMLIHVYIWKRAPGWKSV
ncbi:MAG: hypothetical protein ACFFAL_03640 [Promethearchaeota archaeon]